MKFPNIKINFITTEVIVLAVIIISTVSALLVLVLYQNINSNNLAIKMKNTAYNLSEAINSIGSFNHNTLQDIAPDVDTFGSLLCSKVNCLKVCPVGRKKGECFSDSNWRQLDGRDGNADFSSYSYRLEISNGVQMAVTYSDPHCKMESFKVGDTGIQCGWLHIDVNGFNSPNTLGRDIFGFFITSKGLQPMGIKGTDIVNGNCDPVDSEKPNNGNGCTHRVLTENKINY